MNRGIGELSVCPETEGAPYPDILSTYGSRESERRHLLREGSSEETAPAKIADLSAEARQLPKVMMAPGRQDAQARQARIIEAIYNASGREVPPQYRSKEPITGKIDIPERIQQTLEGIADKDVDETGSPVVSPSNFARQYSLPPPVKSKEDDRTGLTTTATLREIWTRPVKTQAQATSSPAVGLDATQRALPATPGPLGISRDAAASSGGPGMEPVRQHQTSAQPRPGSERQRQAQVRSFPSGSASGATPATTQIWQPDQGGKK
ncbi:hypothetical protein ANCCAN_24583 [Ancylostoma caninum]|uniref:Uncharacterized protein n=1 Tax=Ancylostoma caninum TaxID=29170 RepID=A0A368FDI3_ANCCA|nr:hypothetical protein ANCCAN_24583 [Ancylostoma caninum]